MDSQAAMAPTNIVEADGDDLTGAQAISSDQQKHCVIPQSHRGLLLDAFQQRRDCVPGKRARQLLKPVEAGRVDLAIEPRSHSAIHREEPKQAANAGYLMLEACAAQALACLCDVRLYVAGLNSVERNTA